MGKVINNYRGYYYFLSNFYPCKFEWEGRMWRSVEHAFQAAKTSHPYTRDAIQATKTAVEARVMGHNVRPLPFDWEDRKVAIMTELLKAKFSQNPNLQNRLEKTKNKLLAEMTINDPYWNVTPSGGKNVLGKTLMGIRDGTI